MGTGRQPPIERPGAVLEQGGLLRGDLGLGVGLLHVGGEDGRGEERHHLVEDAGVAGGPHVVGDRMGKPEQVVRAARARPSASGLVPPVLDVAFLELPGRGPEEVRPHQGRPGEHERHHVLQLIAEAEGAAGLVIAGTGPDPATQVLEEQPAIHQDVEGVVGRVHLHRAQHVVPAPGHPLQRGLRRGDRAVPGRQLTDVLRVPPLAEQEDDPPGLAGSQGDLDLQAGAGIQPGPEPFEERIVVERGGRLDGAVPPQEGGPVPGAGENGLAHLGEGHAPRQLLVPGTRGQDRTALRVPPRDDVQVLPFLRRSQDPLDVAEDAQAPGGRALVRHGEDGELHRVHVVHEDRELVPDAVHGVREPGDAGRVANHVAPARRGPGQRPRRRRPGRARVLVPDEDGLGRRVGHRVVGEGREPVLAAVRRPGEGRAGGRDDRAEARVGDDVHPGRRGLLRSLEHDDVLAAAGRRTHRSRWRGSGGAPPAARTARAGEPVRERDPGPAARSTGEGADRAAAPVRPARRSGSPSPPSRAGAARPPASDPGATGRRRPAGASRPSRVRPRAAR